MMANYRNTDSPQLHNHNDIILFCFIILIAQVYIATGLLTVNLLADGVGINVSLITYKSKLPSNIASIMHNHMTN